MPAFWGVFSWNLVYQRLGFRHWPNAPNLQNLPKTKQNKTKTPNLAQIRCFFGRKWYIEGSQNCALIANSDFSESSRHIHVQNLRELCAKPTILELEPVLGVEWNPHWNRVQLQVWSQLATDFTWSYHIKTCPRMTGMAYILNLQLILYDPITSKLVQGWQEVQSRSYKIEWPNCVVWLVMVSKACNI